MGSKSKNKDRDRERSPTSAHKKKHKRRGSRSPEHEAGGDPKPKKSKKSKHRHRDSESSPAGGNGHHKDSAHSGGDSPVVANSAEDNFLSKSPDCQQKQQQQHQDSRPSQNSLYERRTPREFSPLGEDDIVNLGKSPTPPPPQQQRKEAPQDAGPAAAGGRESASLSIDETNRIRAKLGLKPLEVGGAKKDNEPSGGLQEDIHAPATNIAKDKAKEKIKDKLELIKEKRKVNQKLSKVKGLADSDSDDEVLNWVAKSRKSEAEKKKAAERAKMLDEMDDEFGVGKIVEEETQRRGGQLLGNSRGYTSKDLTGLKVDHDQAEFSEERSTILTLKDANILDNEDGDVLMNVNIAENERTKKNLDNKKPGAGTYKAYDDDEVDEFGQFKAKQILDKYDEELDGPNKESFQLGRGGQYDTSAEAKMAEIRKQMSAQAQSLDMVAPTLATEYLSKEEMTFKKKKRRVKKVRQRGSGILTSDDLLASAPEADNPDLVSRKDRGNRKQRERGGMEEEDGGGGGGGGEDDMDVDPQEVGCGWATIEGSDVDLSGDVAVDFVEDQKSFERALSKARKLKTVATSSSFPSSSSATTSASTLEAKDTKVAEKVRVLEKLREAAERKKKKAKVGEEADGGGEGVRQKGEVQFNATSEFFRVLGELPTYGQSGNRDSDEEDQLDFEKEAEAEKKIEEGIATGVSTVYDNRGIGTWNEVDDDDEDGDGNDQAPPPDKEMAFMDEEPSADVGIAGALQLAMKKGYVVQEDDKKSAMASARAKEDLTSKNYSIEDKNMMDKDDKYSNRRDDRYNGPTSKFSEKEGYKPYVKLDYLDDYGNPMSQKEAFRFLSHRFHGKGSGKMKTEKRNKKLLEVESIKKMASGDTPLGTMKKLKEKQKAVGSAYVTLSGGKSQAGDLKK